MRTVKCYVCIHIYLQTFICIFDSIKVSGNSQHPQDKQLMLRTPHSLYTFHHLPFKKIINMDATRDSHSK